MQLRARVPCCFLALALVLAGPVALGLEEMTDAQKASIDKAVKWLLKAQNKDGSWGLDEKTEGDITCTALSVLALMSMGDTDREGENDEVLGAVKRGVNWVLDKAKKAKGDICNSETTLIQGKLGRRVHNFFAVIMLTQLHGMRSIASDHESDEELRNTIGKLTDIIAGSQEPDGSWHKETWGSLKSTCMAFLALRSAASVGVPIKHAAVDKTIAFIKKQYNPSSRLFELSQGGGMGSYQTLYATSSCVRVMYGIGKGDDPQTASATDEFTKQCSKGQWSSMFLTVEGEDYLAALMMTHALVNEKGERWNKWFPYIRDALLKRQDKATGTWTTTACIRGKTFPTVCAIMTLTTPNRLLPMQEL